MSRNYPTPKGTTWNNEDVLIECPFCQKTHIHQYVGLQKTPCNHEYLILMGNITVVNNKTKNIIQRKLDAI